MPRTEAEAAVGRELEVLTADTGAAMVGYGGRTFVVVELEDDPVVSPPGAYVVTDPVEALQLRDSLDDTDNRTYTTREAAEYLRGRRASRDKS